MDSYGVSARRDLHTAARRSCRQQENASDVGSGGAPHHIVTCTPVDLHWCGHSSVPGALLRAAAVQDHALEPDRVLLVADSNSHDTLGHKPDSWTMIHTLHARVPSTHCRGQVAGLCRFDRLNFNVVGVCVGSERGGVLPGQPTKAIGVTSASSRCCWSWPP